MTRFALALALIAATGCGQAAITRCHNCQPENTEAIEAELRDLAPGDYRCRTCNTEITKLEPPAITLEHTGELIRRERW